jgi:hypothetical protein
MEIPSFQWSKVSRHPEWTPYIDAWFGKFEVGVNSNFQLILNKLLL